MADEPLRILRVVIGLNQGGVQQAVLNLFKGLDKTRFLPIACAIENSGAIGEEIRAAGFEVITLGYRRQPLRTILALAHIMRERRIDIVHASSYHPSFYARIAALLARVPVLISHEHVVFDHKRVQRVLLNKLLAPLTDGFIAVGNAVAQQVLGWYGYPAQKVQVIHNGVDTARFVPPQSRAEAKRKLGLDPERLAVGMICRLDHEKGHRFFFDAVSALDSRFAVQWLVVGTGRGEQQIRQEAEERGVGDAVQFLGLRRDVPDLLAAMDIYVLPTLQEGFPNSLLEAMAAGCAVVASDFPGNLELVQDQQNGLVAPMGDSGVLTDCIEKLLAHEDLRIRLGAEARRHVESTFSIEQNVKKTENFYERLWRGRRAAR